MSDDSWTNPLGLTVLILWFSVVAVGWVVAVVGASVGWAVWRWASRRGQAAAS